MNTQLNRKPDWRTLNIDHSVRPRRCHARHIYGELQPMNREDKSAPYFLGLAVIVFGYFIFRGMF